MFFGEYQHSLDAKGRVILPAKFRDQLEGGAYVTKLLDGCLAVYPPQVFEAVATEMNEKAKRGARERNAARSFFAGTVDVTPDRQGRIALPQNLREFAALERDVTVNGAFNRIEIWDAERWRSLNRDAEQELSDGGSDLSDLGM